MKRALPGGLPLIPLTRGSRLLLAACLLTVMNGAYAVPSFSRQTGVACTQCHVNAFGPKLNSFGRNFKLMGFTLGSGDQKFPPLSAMIQGPSFTHSAVSVPDLGPGGPPSHNWNTNDNLTIDQLSLFYGGKIFTSSVVNAGALAQLTYNANENKVGWDNSDIRFARNLTIANEGVNFGVSLNNNPTVQDLWNTTPAWSFPFASTANPDLPTPSPAGNTLIGAVGGQVGGATAFALLDQWLYVEAGAYTTLSTAAQIALGAGNPTAVETENQIDGGAPYWRVALQHDFTHSYLEIGHYGFDADVLPGRVRGFGHDHHTDLAVDATWQYDPFGDKSHVFEIWGTTIWETLHLASSFAQGLSAGLDETGRSLNVNAAYTIKQTYQFNVGYFSVNGSHDEILWGGPAPLGTPNGAGISGKPDTKALVVEFDYTPFGKADSVWAPWLNARFAVQYTAFEEFLGRSTNYTSFTDDHGNIIQRDASDNDTLFLNAWFIF